MQAHTPSIHFIIIQVGMMGFTMVPKQRMLRGRIYMIVYMYTEGFNMDLICGEVSSVVMLSHSSVMILSNAWCRTRRRLLK